MSIGPSIGQGIGWLDTLRKQSRTAFDAQGLPTTRIESWKYTSLKPLDGFAFARPTAQKGKTGGTDDALAKLAGTYLVFVDGAFDMKASRAQSPHAMPLSMALQKNADAVHQYLGHIAASDDPLTLLNSGFIDDGLVLMIERDTIDAPIVVEHISSAVGDGVALHPRNLIVLKKNARATVIERFSGSGRYLINPVSEIVVEDGAKLTHIRLFEDADTAFNLSHLTARVGKDAGYESHVLATGGSLVRNEMKIELAAAGADAALCGAYLARGKQHTDHTTVLRHAAPHTTSRELYKGALNDAARGVFQGNIYVAKGADGTDGNMTNRTILLSDKCEMDTKPQLEIYADDVKCAHGATVGNLEEDALFYLRARGIPERQARELLVEGFVAEAFDGLGEGAIVDLLRARIGAWLATAKVSEAA
jgi:Fe-S cluster assembly protein SufD